MTIGPRWRGSGEGKRAEVDDRGSEQRVLAAGRPAEGERHMLIPESVQPVLAIGRSVEGEQHMLIPGILWTIGC